ncbi:unnamed protein product [Candida verbasci]|uniref:Protein kinase domain-containing protein n=1 Tax=Candida verbasci TaxID=1227364 RepID=A0A9W4TS22_9ASCO|nr:unnamed protein product [Candida verbasci]
MSNLINFYINKNSNKTDQNQNQQFQDIQEESSSHDDLNLNYNSPFPLDLKTPPKNVSIHSYSQKYQIISSLGKGSFGTVELAKLKFNKFELLKKHERNNKGTMLYPLQDSKINLSNLVAIKTMKKKLPLLKDYSRVKELKFILDIPSHPCLVQIYEVFVDDINYQLHITMEALNQNLYQLIKSRRNIKFSSTTLKSILSQLLCAIKHIHQFDYFHRDVKPENILVIPTLHFYGSKSSIPPYRKNDNFIIKLGDYGLARHITNRNPYTAYVSTRWYRSPEILLRQNFYSKPIDIWAFGVVATEIANFLPLFPGSNELDQIWKIVKILGSPFVPELTPSSSSSSIDNNYVVPLGGYWNDAIILANKLGISLPIELGFTIDDILQPINSNSDLELLKDVIQSCLMWDPMLRPDANEISKMKYFKETVKLMESYFDKEISMNLTSASLSSSTAPINTPITPSSTSPSIYNHATYNKLAGIPNSPSRKFLSTTNHNHQRIKSKKVNHHNISVYQDLDDGYENYFSEYIIAPKDDSNSDIVSITTSTTVKAKEATWISKFKGVLSSNNDEMEQQQQQPRSFNEQKKIKNDKKHRKNSIVGTKRSYSTLSFENND